MVSLSEALFSLFNEKKIIIRSIVGCEDTQILIKKIINDTDKIEQSEVLNYLLELEYKGINFFHCVSFPFVGDRQYQILSKILIKNIFNFDLMMAEVHQVTLNRYYEWYRASDSRQCLADKKNGKRCRNYVYPPIWAKDFISIEHAYCKLHSSISNVRL